MRSRLVLMLVALAVGAGTGCGSSSSHSDGGGGGAAGAGGGTAGAGGAGGAGTGGAATGGADGGANPPLDGGSMTCNPPCGSGSVCVGTGTQGGAIILPNDAGVCPSGTHPAGNFCTQDLGYACMTLPAGCGGTASCACASSLCPPAHSCFGAGAGSLNCVELVP